MSNRNIIVNTSEPKPGILGRGDLFAIAVGMVIGSGMVTLIGPAMAYTGYSVWLAYLTAIVMGFLWYSRTLFWAEPCEWQEVLTPL